jgi:hypothetical protein
VNNNSLVIPGAVAGGPSSILAVWMVHEAVIATNFMAVLDLLPSPSPVTTSCHQNEIKSMVTHLLWLIKMLVVDGNLRNLGEISDKCVELTREQRKEKE